MEGVGTPGPGADHKVAPRKGMCSTTRTTTTSTTAVIIIIIIIINNISFMQGIHTYIPETNYVPREYSVAAILLLLFKVLIILLLLLLLLSNWGIKHGDPQSQSCKSVDIIGSRIMAQC
jgi:hypothetical protein